MVKITGEKYDVYLLFLFQRANKAELEVQKYSISDFIDSGDIWSLMDRQLPDDVIYDLAGNKKLVTVDELTGKYHTFKIYEDKDHIQYVIDPDTGHKYLVKSSTVQKEVDIYRMFEDTDGNVLVVDWADMTINKIKLNKHREVVLVPVDK